MENYYQIQEISGGSIKFLLGLLVLPLLIMFLIYLAFSNFTKIKGLIVGINLVISLLVGFSFLFSLKKNTVLLSGQNLIITNHFYPQSIPKNTLLPGKAKVVNLDTNSPYHLTTRLKGITISDYHSGWYKLQNGEKALVLVTRYSDVVYIPTNKDYSILISVTQPNRLLKDLFHP